MGFIEIDCRRISGEFKHSWGTAEKLYKSEAPRPFCDVAHSGIFLGNLVQKIKKIDMAAIYDKCWCVLTMTITPIIIIILSSWHDFHPRILVFSYIYLHISDLFFGKLILLGCGIAVWRAYVEWFQGGQFLGRRRWDLGEVPTNRNSAGVGLGNQWSMCDIKCDNPSISLQSPYLQISIDYWGLRAWVSPALPREKIRVSILARCQIEGPKKVSRLGPAWELRLGDPQNPDYIGSSGC